MNEGIRLTEIGWDRQNTFCAFEVDPRFAHLFWDERVLTLSCSEGVRPDAENVVAGFLLAMAPVGWTFGASISCSGLAVPQPALDCMNRVGAYLRGHYGWRDHDPFRDVLTRPARWDHPRSHRALLWSGGVDSAYALITARDSVDWLVHLTNFENLESRMTDEQRSSELASTWRTADERGLGWMRARTNIPSIFKHNRFDDAFPPDCSFWLGLEHVQHIATALSIVRPLLAEVVMAGGFNELVRHVGSCAADASFIEQYDYPAPLRLVDELVPRQQKIETLLDRAPELLRTLRVCFSSGDATCAGCNKCQTTALMILAGGGTLGETPFPREIATSMLTRIEEIRRNGVKGHGSFKQALDGRVLSGSPEERWSQLERLIHVSM